MTNPTGWGKLHSRECLLRIFKYSLFNKYTTRGTLCKVSGKWKKLVIKSPELWTEIDCSRSIETIKTYLKHSRGRPLKIINFNVVTNAPNKTAQDIVDALIKHSKQWKDLTIEIPRITARKRPHPIISCHTGCALTHLDMTVPEGQDSRVDVTTLFRRTNVPRLQYLYTTGILILPDHPGVFSQLIELKMNTMYSVRDSTIYKLVSRLPMIETLTLQLHGYRLTPEFSGPGQPKPAIVQLNRLRYLDINSASGILGHSFLQFVAIHADVIQQVSMTLDTIAKWCRLPTLGTPTFQNMQVSPHATFSGFIQSPFTPTFAALGDRTSSQNVRPTLQLQWGRGSTSDNSTAEFYFNSGIEQLWTQFSLFGYDQALSGIRHLEISIEVTLGARIAFVSLKNLEHLSFHRLSLAPSLKATIQISTLSRRILPHLKRLGIINCFGRYGIELRDLIVSLISPVPSRNLPERRFQLNVTGGNRNEVHLLDPEFPMRKEIELILGPENCEWHERHP